MQLSRGRANIHCFKAASMPLWLGCLFLRPLSFGSGLATESPLYYWLGYCYGADKNVWVGYKFQRAPSSLQRDSMCSLESFIFWVSGCEKTSLNRIENCLCLRTWAIFFYCTLLFKAFSSFLTRFFFTRRKCIHHFRKIIDKENILTHLESITNDERGLD